MADPNLLSWASLSGEGRSTEPKSCGGWRERVHDAMTLPPVPPGRREAVCCAARLKVIALFGDHPQVEPPCGWGLGGPGDDRTQGHGRVDLHQGFPGGTPAEELTGPAWG